MHRALVAIGLWAAIFAVAGIIMGLWWLFTPANAQTITTQCNTMGCGVEPWPEQLLPTYCMKGGIPVPACVMSFDPPTTAAPTCDEGYTLMRYADNLSLICARDLRPTK